MRWFLIPLVFILGCKNKRFLAERIVYVTDSTNVPFKFREIDERYLFDHLGRTVEHTFYEEQKPDESTRFIYNGKNVKPDIVINNLNGDTIRDGTYDYRTINFKMICNYDSLKCRLDSSVICEFRDGILTSKKKIIQIGQNEKKQTVYFYLYKYKK